MRGLIRMMILALIPIVIALSLARGDYDPDQSLTTPQIIRRHGYPSESHVVRTDDGYLLALHRIPNGRKNTGKSGKVVFLQHGLLSSSCDWVLAGPNKSLAFILADNGYDVWMGNIRGNTYSRAHAEISPDSTEFWNFTWHEMAMYDVPCMINYILDRTNQKALFYIGHSMGSTIFFAMSSMRPDLGSKVKAMFALAPVAFMTNVKSPIRFLVPWANDVEFIVRYLGDGEFLPQTKILKFLSKYGCELVAWEKEICRNIVFVLCGFDRQQFNMSLLPVILAHSPAGTSTKTIIHYAQEIKSGKFQEFDYGKTGNMEKYGTPEPPQYNLSSIKTPISLHYGNNDWLSNEIDVEHLYDKLTVKIGKFRVKYDGFNHIDFLWGIDAKTLVYDKILKILQSFR